MGQKIFDVLTLIVFVALVTTVVAHKNSIAVIRASGAAFSNAIRAAQGK